MRFAISLTLSAVLVGVSAGADAPADLIVRTELPLQTPRSRDPVLGGARDKVFFQVTIPEGVRTVRGAVCNPFSKDEAVGKHWRAACRHWGFAFVQTDFDAVKKDEYVLLQVALAELAKQSKHPEIEHMPLCFTGMSRGGGMSMQLAELLPERTVASVPVCLEVGPATERSRLIPVLTVFGEKDGQQMPLLMDKLPRERAQEARWALAVQWGRRHEFGQANNLSFVFLDEVIGRRLPVQGERDRPATLRTIALEDGWLADPTTWSPDGRRPVIHPWKDTQGDRARACWFPGQRTAAVWQAFVGASKDVTISAPPGLGDGQPFVPHSSARPITIQAALASGLKPKQVELWDAHERLGSRTAPPWEFAVTLKPGIHSLIVSVEEVDRPLRASRPHTIVVGD